MAKNDAGTNIISRTWKMKKGNEIPFDHLDGQEIRVRMIGDTTDPQVFLASALALAGGNVEAVVDTFNSAAVLAFQKSVKAQATADSTLEQLQQVADSAVLTPNQRGGGQPGGKKAAVKAKAEKLDSATNRIHEQLNALRESDPAEYEKQRAMFESLGLI